MPSSDLRKNTFLVKSINDRVKNYCRFEKAELLPLPFGRNQSASGRNQPIMSCSSSRNPLKYSASTCMFHCSQRVRRGSPKICGPPPFVLLPYSIPFRSGIASRSSRKSVFFEISVNTVANASFQILANGIAVFQTAMLRKWIVRSIAEVIPPTSFQFTQRYFSQFIRASSHVDVAVGFFHGCWAAWGLLDDIFAIIGRKTGLGLRLFLSVQTLVLVLLYERTKVLHLWL